jgi:tetratricopeptide (TPR) repeat protein
MARATTDAVAQLRRAVELGEQFDKGKGTFLFLATADYGVALALSGHFDEAERVLTATLPLAKENAAPANLAAVMNAIGLHKQLQFLWAESERAFRQALEHTSSSEANQRFRAEALLGIGIARLEMGHAVEAEDWLRRADAAARVTFLNLMPLRADIAMQLGRSLLAQKKMDAARESLSIADTYWQSFDTSNRSAGEAAYWLAQAYLATAAKDQARAALSRAIVALKGSPLPGDLRLLAGARRAASQLPD